MISGLESALSCIRCGFCEPSCPTLKPLGGFPIYSPRGRVLLAKGLMEGDLQFSRSLYQSYYTCLRCERCSVSCPAGVNGGEISLEFRKMIAKNFSELIEDKIKIAIDLLRRSGTPLGIDIKVLNEWSKDVFKEEGEYLFYTGLLYQLAPYTHEILNRISTGLGKRLLKILSMPGSTKFIHFIIKGWVSHKNIKRYSGILKNIVELLNYCGNKLLYSPREPYIGILAYEMGFEDEFKRHLFKVVEFFRSNRVKKVIVIDPHTAEALIRIAPRYIKDFDFEVIYYLNLIYEKIKDDEFWFKRKIKAIIHDPCRLARGLKLHEILRSVLSRINNLEIIDFQSSGLQTECCGAPVELVNFELSRKIAAKRVRELSNKSKLIITACPLCLSMLSALSEHEDCKVYDIAEVLFNALTSHEL